MMDFSKKLMLIINPVAGRREASKNLAGIIRVFSEGGYLVSVFVTSKSGDAAAFARAYGAGFDLIVCSGGDGTMNETVNGIISGGLDIPVGYIPSGSYNDFADYHGLSKNVLTAAQNIVDGQRHPLDAIQFDDKYFVNAADFGAFTWLPYSTPQVMKNTLGAYAYILDGIKDLSKIRSHRLRLLANGGVFEGEYLFGIVCNATMVGGILANKGALVQSDDGFFEVGMIRKPNNPQEFQETVIALKNEDLSSPRITFFKTSRLTIETDEPLDWSLDGEFAQGAQPTELRLLHSRIDFVF